MRNFTKRHYIAALVAIVLLFLFYSLYSDLRHKTIDDFNRQQFILLDKSGESIRAFFTDHLHHLNILARQHDIIHFSSTGKELLRLILAEYPDQLRAVTRMDSSGRILYSLPDSERTVGVDISGQAHVQRLLETRAPVLSDVFDAVQGYRTIAMHVPVFDKDQIFHGSLALLFDYERAVESYVQDMVGTREHHYAWILSAAGNELYCQQGEHIGQNIDSTGSHTDLADRMISGERGTAVYYAEGGGSRSQRARQTVFAPYDVMGKRWAMAISAPESHILRTIARYRWNLIFLSIGVLLISTIYIYFTVQARIVARNRTFQNALTELSQALTQPLSAHQIGRVVARSTHKIFGYDAFSLDYLAQAGSLLVSIYNEDTFENESGPREVEIEPMEVDANTVIMGRGESRLINRSTAEEAFPFRPFGDISKRSLSLLFIPVYWESEQIAILSIQSYKRNRFTPEDQDRLQIIAGELGGALARVREEEQLQEKTVALEQSLREKDLLIREVFHRTKNNMQLIISMLNMQNDITRDLNVKQAFGDIKHRIYAMSLAHEMLYRSDDLSRIDLRLYIHDLLVNISRAYPGSSPKIRFTLDVPEIHFNLDTVMPLGLGLNEVLSNTYKHAFPDGESGELKVRAVEGDDQVIELEIQDTGIGLSADQMEDPANLGLRLIRILFEDQLGGSLKMDGSQGVRYSIRFKPIVPRTPLIS